MGNQKWKYCFGNYNGSSFVAIREDGLLFTWGNNSYGQLGLGDINDRSSPVQVGNKKWKFANIAYENASAIDENGYLFCWGSNRYGMLGTGDNVWISSPVQIGTDKWLTLADSSTSYSSGAIREDGVLFTWGYNGGSRTTDPGGQLGTGDSISRSSPVQIGTEQWKAVSFSGFSMYGLKKDGTLFRSGQPISGYTTARVSSPVQLGTKKWKTMAGDMSSFIDFENNFFIRYSNPISFTNGVQPSTSGFYYMEKGYRNRITYDVIFESIFVGPTVTTYIGFINQDVKASACFGRIYISI